MSREREGKLEVGELNSSSLPPRHSSSSCLLLSSTSHLKLLIDISGLPARAYSSLVDVFYRTNSLSPPRCSPQPSSSLFLSHNPALGPPYRVLVDTNFINHSLQNKLELVQGMMDCLFAKCEHHVLPQSTRAPLV